MFWAGSLHVPPDPHAPLDALRGWTLALPLLFILLCHEFGHYLLARRHRVDVSPPFFLPFPSLIGTFGAFIIIRGRLYNRRTLLDIGAAGPLAGFVPSLLLLYVGYRLSAIGPLPVSGQAGSVLVFGESVLTLGMRYLVFGPLPAGYDIYLHPVALAAWVGLFLTFLNLLPIGTLDGGHVAYALWGRKQWRIGRVALAVLVVLALLLNRWWLVPLVMIVLVIVVAVVVMRLRYRVHLPLGSLLRGGMAHHPPLPNEEPLDPVRRRIGWLCLVIFLLAFAPVFHA